jgi:hypothetical protein
VEDILRHSAVVVKDRAIGIPEACPDRYVLAFPYKEPDRRGGMTLEITSLIRQADGTIVEGEHTPLWNLKGEGMDPERCKRIIIEDRSEPGLIRVAFRVQDPDDSSWRIGVASGECPGEEVWLRAYFLLDHPEDHNLVITQFNDEAPVDYWLQDGDQLSYYQWKPWTEQLIWSLSPIPGKLIEVDWNENSQDYSGDGVPDLHITWDINGEPTRWIYAAEQGSFISFGPIE